MKKKGIAIQTILLLLIGVLVAGVLVYFVYRYFSGGSLSREDCRGIMVGWCTTCWTATRNVGAVCATDWNAVACKVGPPASEELVNCASDYFQITIASVNLCQGYSDECANFIPM